MSDVRLDNTDDGGEITIVNGTPFIDDGLSTSVYLSLFGGNEDDSGLTDGESLQWWGNLGERVAERRYRSETQYLMRSLASVPRNLRRIEDAVGNDLAWMVTEFGASIAARASIPALNTTRLQVEVQIDKQKIAFTFDEHHKES